MRSHIENLLIKALTTLQHNTYPELIVPSTVHLERTRSKEFGDYASNIAMSLAKSLGIKPRDLAQHIINSIPKDDPYLKQTAIAGPGFINFYVKINAYNVVIQNILSQRELFGQGQIDNPRKINVEFVSSNPTGPLHVGHGRGAAFGSVLANILQSAGHQVCREYYVNDAGRQMHILAVSVWLRYLELFNQDIFFPENGYKGDYVKEIALAVKNAYDRQFFLSADDLFSSSNLQHIKEEGGDQEEYMDKLIEKTKKSLGQENYQIIYNWALESVLKSIRDDLEKFNVHFDVWFSEKSLEESGILSRSLNVLKKGGYTYEQNGAIWFRSTEFGDDKDRVLVRENGLPTYFASDVAYLLEKKNRGFDELIFVVGADHHGYIARLKAAATALGIDPQAVKVLIVQFAVLYRGQERIQMSTRSGSFVTLSELQEEIGTDAARFFYVMRKCEQHMDFDLNLAKETSKHNPVYYLQYAHARIASVFSQMAQRGEFYDSKIGLEHLDLLNTEFEQSLLATLSRYPDVLINAARHYEPHHLILYLIELTQDFHSYYNATVFLVPEIELRQARLCLIDAIKQIVQNALKILLINAPERLTWS